MCGKPCCALNAWSALHSFATKASCSTHPREVRGSRGRSCCALNAWCALHSLASSASCSMHLREVAHWSFPSGVRSIFSNFLGVHCSRRTARFQGVCKAFSISWVCIASASWVHTERFQAVCGAFSLTSWVCVASASWVHTECFQAVHRAFSRCASLQKISPRQRLVVDPAPCCTNHQHL